MLDKQWHRPKKSGSARIAALLACMIISGTSVAWGATEDSPQPGIVETGVNVWTISSTPLTASIKLDDAAHNALPKAIRDAGVLKIGAITDEPPFIFIKNGKLQGVDIDMMGGLARALGIKVELHKTSFEGMIPGLKADRFDAIMGDLTDTASRETIVDFVDYIKNEQTVMVRKDETRDFSSPLNICGHSAAAPKASLSVRITEELSAICVKKGLKPITIDTYPSSAQVFLALETGRVDVSPITYAIAVYLQKQDPGKYSITNSLFYQSYKGAAILKDHPDLFKALTSGFQAVISSANYDQVLSAWGLEKLKNDKVYVNVPGKQLNETIK